MKPIKEILDGAKIDPEEFHLDCDCPICEDTGWTLSEHGMRRCDCFYSRRRNQRASRVPIAFRGTSLLVPPRPNQVEAFAKVSAHPAESYYFVGGVGRGKTFLAAAQYMAQPLSRQVVWTSMADLIHDLIQQEVEKIPARCYQLKTGDQLYVDDIDKLKLTEWKAEALFSLVDWLYREQIGLTATSNLTLKQLQDKLGPAAVRRIADICEVVEV